MLVLSRKKSEVIVIGGSNAREASVRIVVLEIDNRYLKLGNEAPACVAVHRMEVWERIQTDQIMAKAS